MLSLRGRQDAFRLVLPKEFICEEIEEKYAQILRSKNSFYHKPIDFLNETIQGVQVFGFQEATYQQMQTNYGKESLLNRNTDQANQFNMPASEYTYRAAESPLNIIDKTLNITFRHTLGYLNYFLLFENFFYQYTRDRFYNELIPHMNIDIFNERGAIYSKIVLESPLISGMDMLDFNYTQPVAQSQTFNVAVKYSNFDFQFIEIEEPVKSEINIEID